MYFKHKLKKDDLKKINLKEWCLKTEGLTLSHLGEVIKSVIIFGHDIDETIKILKDMRNVVSSRNYNKQGKDSLGFVKSTGSEEMPEDCEKDDDEVDESSKETGLVVVGNDVASGHWEAKVSVPVIYDSLAEGGTSGQGNVDVNLFEDKKE